MAKYIAYYRVSTKRQGLGLDAQKASVAAFISTQDGAQLVAEFSEKESGKNNNRPQLAAAISAANAQNATLIIAKLDRLSRDVAFLFELKKAVNFCALDVPNCNTLTLAIFAGLAQQERELISTRTKAALAAKKAQGAKLGAPGAHFTDEMRQAAYAAHTANAKANPNNTRAWALVRVLMEQGKTLRAMAADLNASGYTTARGKQWQAASVLQLQRLMAV